MEGVKVRVGGMGKMGKMGLILGRRLRRLRLLRIRLRKRCCRGCALGLCVRLCWVLMIFDEFYGF